MVRIRIDRHRVATAQVPKQSSGVVAAVQAHHAGLLPGFAQPGKTGGYGGDVGQDSDPFGPQPAHQKRTDAIKQGVSGGEHHDGVVVQVGLEKIGQAIQIPVDDPPLAIQMVEWLEEPSAAHEDFRGFDGLSLPGGQVVWGDARADDGQGWCQWCFLYCCQLR